MHFRCRPSLCWPSSTLRRSTTTWPEVLKSAWGAGGPRRSRDILKDRSLLTFLVCDVLFHFANAAMLPLLGEQLAQGKGKSSMPFLCGTKSRNLGAKAGSTHSVRCASHPGVALHSDFQHRVSRGCAGAGWHRGRNLQCCLRPRHRPECRPPPRFPRRLLLPFCGGGGGLHGLLFRHARDSRRWASFVLTDTVVCSGQELSAS